MTTKLLPGKADALKKCLGRAVSSPSVPLGALMLSEKGETELKMPIHPSPLPSAAHGLHHVWWVIYIALLWVFITDLAPRAEGHEDGDALFNFSCEIDVSMPSSSETSGFSSLGVTWHLPSPAHLS